MIELVMQVKQTFFFNREDFCFPDTKEERKTKVNKQTVNIGVGVGWLSYFKHWCLPGISQLSHVYF